MSASSKKKLRNEQAAEKMTQRQLAEQKEAKKLKTMTIVFGVVLAAMLIFAVAFSAYNLVTGSGVLQKNTVAATVGDHDIDSVELSYYYIDYINNFYSNYSSYISYFLDTTAPLDEQQCSFSDEGTWADYFLEEAAYSAASTYALYDAAVAAGHTMTEEEEAQIESSITTAYVYAVMYYGYSDLDSYLAAMYGTGADEESYREYLTVSALASSYYNAYTASLSYTEDEIRAADAADPLAYNSYDYSYYYIAASDFLTGGTTDAEGNITYSDEETAAARAAAEEAAQSLLIETITTTELFDMGIALINDDDTSFTCEGYSYSSLLSVAQEWIADESRVEGDKNYFAYTTHTHADGETHSDDEDTSAYDVVKGYYVVLYHGCNDNTTEMINVRHVLVTEGGTLDTTTGLYTYTDDMAAAKAKAEELLAEWQAGDATEDSFAELANSNSSDTGSNTTGGLYEDVYPGQMVTNFNDWCFDASRKAGDTGIVQSDYGYHIMYFVGGTGMTYRDYMIEEDLSSADITEWYTAITEGVTSELKNTKYIQTDLVLG